MKAVSRWWWQTRRADGPHRRFSSMQRKEAEWVARREQRTSPSPVPPALDGPAPSLICENGRKSLCCWSSGIPSPVSRIENSTHWRGHPVPECVAAVFGPPESRGTTRTTTSPPSGVNFVAAASKARGGKEESRMSQRARRRGGAAARTAGHGAGGDEQAGRRLHESA